MGSTESRTVLVVDDEVSLRGLLERVVERGGAKALVAGTAIEARRLFEAQVGEIDVILLDVQMPDGEGAATLMPEFLERRPDLQVILTSGDALPPSLEIALARVGGAFLRKPFAPKALMQLLEGPNAGAPGSVSSFGSPGPGGMA